MAHRGANKGRAVRRAAGKRHPGAQTGLGEASEAAFRHTARKVRSWAVCIWRGIGGTGEGGDCHLPPPESSHQTKRGGTRAWGGGEPHGDLKDVPSGPPHVPWREEGRLELHFEDSPLGRRVSRLTPRRQPGRGSSAFPQGPVAGGRAAAAAAPPRGGTRLRAQCCAACGGKKAAREHERSAAGRKVSMTREGNPGEVS